MPARGMRSRGRAPCLLGALLCITLFAACAPQAPSAASATHSATATFPAASAPAYAGATYVDAKLGFSVLVPQGWNARPEPGLRAPAGNSTVVLVDGQHPGAELQISAMRSPTMPAAFAARGTPTALIGAYPAFVADTTLQQGLMPCLVRIFLAAQDYVVADWCALDAASHAADLERILATYHAAPAGYTPHAPPASADPRDCAAVQGERGYDPQTARWGQTLAGPLATSPAAGWGAFDPGAYVCSNSGSPDRYLFECTELVNRFILEQWALPHIPGSAARYMDYYQDGTLQPGAIRDLPTGSYQLSDDASQGHSAFRPQPGDLLIFQDVTAPARGWTSGLTSSHGHVAIITAVDSSSVYVAQENYSDSQYFLALPITTTPNGWAITDRSGIANRIVRGWIHFTANGGG